MLLGGGSSLECESSIKYFLVQVVGSIVVLGGALINLFYVGLFYVEGYLVGELTSFLVGVGLIIKIGLVPFHFWVPRVMSGVS